MDFTKGLIEFLKGKKTYIIGAMMILYVLEKYAFEGIFDSDLLLQALAIVGLRAGIAKQ